MKKIALLVGLVLTNVSLSYAAVKFEHIKNRKVGQLELTEIMLDLAYTEQLDLLDRWQEVIPNSFKGLDFTDAYLRAAERSLDQKKTNQALSFYIRAYQVIDNKPENKMEASFNAAFFLYAQNRSSEALFYINRALEESEKIRRSNPKAEEIFYLKRRIVWRYFSRLELLPDNAISAVKFDGDDVWIGMWSGGVSRFSRSSSTLEIFNSRNARLPSSFVRDILVENDKVWVSTHEGLTYYNKAKATWHIVPTFNGMKLKSISKFNGAYYLSTLYNGVYRSFDGETWSNIIPSLSVLDFLMVDQDLYIATPENGIYLWKDNVASRFLPKISAKTIIVDSDDRFIWIGTYGQGLLKVRRRDAKVVETIDQKILGSDYIESLLLVDDKLWVGTLESGVSVYDFNRKKWDKLQLKEGLPGLDIMTITRENDYLWFGTLAGGIGIYLFNEEYPIDGGKFRDK